MRYLIQKDGNFGFINEGGHIVIEPIFEQILGSFEEGLGYSGRQNWIYRY